MGVYSGQFQRDVGLIPGQEDPLEEETATHCSILAWKIPWTEEPGRVQSIGWQSQQRKYGSLILLYETTIIKTILSYFSLGPQLFPRSNKEL